MKHHSFHKLVVIAFLVLASAGMAFSQAGRGVGRLGGSVIDMEDKPLEGIKVILQFAQNEALKFEQVTNKKGEWSFIGLGSGAWNIIVAVPGYEPVNQAVQVSQLSVNPKATVRLKKSTASFGGGLIEDEASFEFLEKGGELYKDGKYDEAIAAFQEFKAKNPKAYQVDLNIADCYREKSEFDRAIELYNGVIAQSAADPGIGKEMTAKALAGIGNCYLKQEKIAEAQEYFKKSIDSSPKDELLAYNVGEIYFSNQNQDEALRVFPARRVHQAGVARSADEDRLRLSQQGRHGQRHPRVREVPDSRAGGRAGRPRQEHPRGDQEVACRRGRGPGAPAGAGTRVRPRAGPRTATERPGRRILSSGNPRSWPPRASSSRRGLFCSSVDPGRSRSGVKPASTFFWSPWTRRGPTGSAATGTRAPRPRTWTPWPPAASASPRPTPPSR